jgi:hypothetical protein
MFSAFRRSGTLAFDHSGATPSMFFVVVSFGVVVYVFVGLLVIVFVGVYID